MSKLEPSYWERKVDTLKEAFEKAAVDIKDKVENNAKSIQGEARKASFEKVIEALEADGTIATESKEELCSS